MLPFQGSGRGSIPLGCIGLLLSNKQQLIARLTQLVESHSYEVMVSGSRPLMSTRFIYYL